MKSYISNTTLGKDGLPKINKGKLLWDIIDAIRKYEAQSVYNQENWYKTFKPADLLGKKFQLEIKYAEKQNGDEFVIMNDSYQKLKDARYKETKKTISTNEELEVVANNDDMPF